MSVSNVGDVGAAAKSDPRAQVRKLAQDLEGVFLNQLFQAMRASVPHDGAIGEAPGQEMFTQMLDEKLANQAATKLSDGLTEALVRQLASRLPQAGSTEAR